MKLHNCSAWLILLAFLTACGPVTPFAAPATTSAPTFVPALPTTITALAIGTPKSESTITATPEPDIPPGCIIRNEDGTFYVLSEKEFFAFGPSETKLDDVLVGNYPDWASFEQNVSWYSEPVKVGKIIEGASIREQYGFNPAVTLVTLGESLGWQTPADGDLYTRALETSEALIRPALEWIAPENEQIRAQYPQISNGATYALYVFFEHDEDRLQSWCNTYQRLFGTSP